MSLIEVVQDGQKHKTSSSFFRGENTNFYPRDTSFELDGFIATYVAQGWVPRRRFITAETPIVAFGSCFADNISKHFQKLGFNILTKQDNRAYVTKMGDGIVNTFAIRQQFEWAWEGKVPAADLWHGFDAAAFGYDEGVRLETKALFDAAEVFIITLGLSEIWYDEPTGEVFWRAVPAEKYDPTRHKFRLSTHGENLANLNRIYELILRHRSDAAIVITVSPIPLYATFRDLPCIVANGASKAILRAAVEEFMQTTVAGDGKVFLFPSYEVVLTLYRNQWAHDRRHVHGHVLNFNMRLFERYFCTTKMNDATLLKVFRRSLELDALIGREGQDALANRKESNDAEAPAKPKPETAKPKKKKSALRRFWKALKGSS